MGAWALLSCSTLLLLIKVYLFLLQVSNVTGENLDYLKMFMNLLSSRSPNTDECPAEFQIDDTYSVPGVGTVVSGTNLKVRFLTSLAPYI